MSLTEAKVKAIHEWAMPQNVKDVRSFLSFTNYYQQFIRNFVEIVSLLTDLTKKGIPWQWGPHQRNAFPALKEAYCNAPVLLFPDPKLPYTVSTDARVSQWGEYCYRIKETGCNHLHFSFRGSRPPNNDIGHMSMSWQ